jgi:hypothetical protein
MEGLEAVGLFPKNREREAIFRTVRRPAGREGDPLPAQEIGFYSSRVEDTESFVSWLRIFRM